MKWNCFRTRQQIILERIQVLDKRLGCLINKQAYYCSFTLEMRTYYEDYINDIQQERESILRAISRMYNLYSKKFDTP